MLCGPLKHIQIARNLIIDVYKSNYTPRAFLWSIAHMMDAKMSWIRLCSVSLFQHDRRPISFQPLLVDLITYAQECLKRATIVILTGDRDFAYALSILRFRQHNILLIPNESATSLLTNQASIVCDYQTVTANLPREETHTTSSSRRSSNATTSSSSARSRPPVVVDANYPSSHRIYTPSSTPSITGEAQGKKRQQDLHTPSPSVAPHPFRLIEPRMLVPVLSSIRDPFRPSILASNSVYLPPNHAHAKNDLKTARRGETNCVVAVNETACRSDILPQTNRSVSRSKRMQRKRSTSPSTLSSPSCGRDVENPFVPHTQTTSSSINPFPQIPSSIPPPHHRRHPFHYENDSPSLFGEAPQDSTTTLLNPFKLSRSPPPLPFRSTPVILNGQTKYPAQHTHGTTLAPGSSLTSSQSGTQDRLEDKFQVAPGTSPVATVNIYARGEMLPSANVGGLFPILGPKSTTQKAERVVSFPALAPTPAPMPSVVNNPSCIPNPAPSIKQTRILRNLPKLKPETKFIPLIRILQQRHESGGHPYYRDELAPKLYKATRDLGDVVINSQNKTKRFKIYMQSAIDGGIIQTSLDKKGRESIELKLQWRDVVKVA